MELVQFKKATFAKNKLIIDEGITIEEWRDLGQGLRQIEGNVQFWLADWMKYGDDAGFSGKRINSKVYDDLEELTGYSRKTLQEVKSVVDRTSTVRTEELSFNHHKEVAALPPHDQKLFLDKAVSENLSTRELREEIKKSTKQDNMLTLQRINDQLDWEKELKDLAKHINITYTKEQRNFLVNQIKL